MKLGLIVVAIPDGTSAGCNPFFYLKPVVFSNILTDFVAGVFGNCKLNAQQESVIVARCTIEYEVGLKKMHMKIFGINEFLNTHQIVVITTHSVGVLKNKLPDSEMQGQVYHQIKGFSSLLAGAFDDRERMHKKQILVLRVFYRTLSLKRQAETFALVLIADAVVRECQGTTCGLAFGCPPDDEGPNFGFEHMLPVFLKRFSFHEYLV